MRISVSLFRPRVTRKGVTTVSKNWNAAWRDPHTGRRCTKSTGTANRQSAQLFANKLQDKLYRQSIGAYDPAEDYLDLLFTDAKGQFLTAKSERLRPDSVEAYRYSLLAFERTMHPKELRKVDTRVIHDFVSARTQQVEAVTTNKDLRHLRAFFNWCHGQGFMGVPPDFKGQFLNVDEADPIWIAEEDVKAVLNAIADPKLVLKRRSSDWWLIFIRMALFTGMRRSELLGLRWSEVDFEAGQVRVVRHTSKGRKDRLYEGAYSLTKLLRQWFLSQSPSPATSDLVLPYDRSPRGLYSDWDLILEHAGIPDERRFTPHSCRSSCVSELLAAGYALTTVRDWVGHSTVAVTERHYAETRTDRKRMANSRKVV